MITLIEPTEKTEAKECRHLYALAWLDEAWHIIDSKEDVEKGDLEFSFCPKCGKPL
jgi:hypothetical protein